MGNNLSTNPEDNDFCSSDDELPSQPVTKFVRMGGTVDEEFQDDDLMAESSLTLASIHKMPYNGTWSIIVPPNKGPIPRTGQFSVYSSEYQTFFTGYGVRRSGQHLNDVWALSTVDYTWHKLRLTGDQISPRMGSTAIMMDNFIVVFGGANDKRFFTELHTIDVTTGEVLISETGGKGKPPSQMGCALGIYKRQLFVWGGHDEESTYNDLYILDFNTMNWSQIRCSVSIGQRFSFTKYRRRIYCYGSSDTQDMRVIDMAKQTVTLQETVGSAPPSNVEGGGMVHAGEYLFVFGGQSKSKYTMMYGYYIPRSWWFVFFVAPDGESTSMTDGRVSKDGLFLLPGISDFSCTYVPENRQIVAFLGHPHKIPVPVFVVSMADALCALNLREDMFAMLSF